MKNVHLLPTGEKFAGISAENIYITSDEEIKYGDWCLDLINNTIYVATKVVVHNLKSLEYEQYIKKITLTTDQDLIKDGVQAIDDDFLEWFVKNPSCEQVKVVDDLKYFNIDELRERHLKGLPHLYSEKIGYKIIIPKEDFVFEISSGYNGYRNKITGKWIYESEYNQIFTNPKQSAVEFAVNKLANLIPSGNQILIRAILIEAKEIEKQQIIDSCYFGSQNLPYEIKDKSEQYYNETFNK